MLAARPAHSHNSGMTKPALRIEDLRAMLEAASPTSKLGRWFTANQAEFDDLLATVRPRWEVLAVKFAEEELIVVPPAFWHEEDTPDRRLARKRAGEAARQVWQRVKHRPARAGAVTPPALTPRAPRRRSTTSGFAAEPPPEAAGDDEFRPARRR
jgi:hypothetical protein